MVTETINDIHPYYLDINNWIKFGVTSEAVCICADQWEYETEHNREWQYWIVMNDIKDTKLTKLTKW